MNDTPRPRRSPTVVLLDAMLSAVTAVQAGNLPGRRRTAGPEATGPDGGAGTGGGPGGSDGGGAGAAGGAPSRRAVSLWMLAGVIGTAAGVVVLIGAVLGTPGGLTNLPLPGRAAPAPPAVASPVPPLTAEPTTTSPRPASASPSRSASVRASASSSAPSVSPSRSAPVVETTRVLTADYAAAYGSGLLGYRATVTLTAEGAASEDWRLSVTLPRSTLRVGNVSGAEAVQEGAVWTFTPIADTRLVTPGEPVVIIFDVRGATLVDSQPTDCRINERACAGL